MEKVKKGSPILVECTAGYKYPENPKAVTINGHRYEIEKIVSRMRTPENEIFHVRLENGKELKILYTADSDKWFIE